MMIINFTGASQAEKALGLLKNYGYIGYIRKTSPGSGKGCGFAVYLDASDENQVRHILESYGIGN